jgi:hypothetical protein
MIDIIHILLGKKRYTPGPLRGHGCVSQGAAASGRLFNFLKQGRAGPVNTATTSSARKRGAMDSEVIIGPRKSTTTTSSGPTGSARQENIPSSSESTKSKRARTFCTSSKLSIRSELLPPKWPKYVSGAVVPVRKNKGVAAWLVRQIVAHTYIGKTYKNRVDFDALNDDEKFACAASMWTGAVSVLQYQGTGCGPSAKAERIARRMYGCYPPGHVFKALSRDRLASQCQHELCPYCYARRVVNMFVDLAKAFKNRPKDSRIWISPIYTFDNRKKFAKKLRTKRPACAAVFHFPTGETKGDDNWRIHGVMMTDDPGKFRDRKYKRRIYNANQIAKALAIWMRYPRPWYARGVVPTARLMTHLFSTLPDSKRRYQTYGVIRDDWYPGRSMLDWKAYDAGAPQDVIDTHERKRSASQIDPGES